MLSSIPIQEITTSQFDELQGVRPSTDGKMEYRPCRVTLADGTILDRVYVVEANIYKESWGVWPWSDRGKKYVLIESVVKIEKSPVRLPARFANWLYEFGESGMGYMIFTLILKDGRRLPFCTGNAVDFPNWPEGVTPEMVDKVQPHAGREFFQHLPINNDGRSAEYWWCLYRLA